MRLLRSKDRLEVKIHDTTFLISPLTRSQQAKIQEYIKIKNGEAEFDAIMTTFYTVKYAVKGVSGIKTMDGEDYQVEFLNEKKEELTDECTEDLLNLECKNELIMAISGIRSGRYDKVLDNNGNELKGVSVNFLSSLKKT